MFNKNLSLQHLMLWHECAFMALVLVTALLGAAGVWHFDRYDAAKDRLQHQGMAAQAIAVNVQDALIHLVHAAAMLDSGVLSRADGWLGVIAEDLRQLTSKSVSLEEKEALEEFSRRAFLITNTLRALPTAAPWAREAVRLRLQGPEFRESVLQPFADAHQRLLAQLALEIRLLEKSRAESISRATWVAALILCLAMWLVSRARSLVRAKAIQPLAELTSGVKQIQESGIGQKVPVSGILETRNLAVAFNDMAASLDQVRQELARREREAALGALVPVIAHNIRNPLASIRATAQLLDSDSGDQEIVESREAIISTADRLAAWVHALLSYLGPQPLDQQPADLGEMMQMLVILASSKAEQLGVTLEFSSNTAAVPILADVNLAEQALFGLVINAIEASPRGGTVSVVIGREESGIRLCIRDSGPGMPFQPDPDSLQPGPTTKHNGCGLGIPFAYKTLRAHAWKIRHELHTDGGTCVVVDLPLAA